MSSQKSAKKQKSSAGIIFCNKTYVLLGFDRRRKLWTGFGGKLKGDESAAHGAVREVLEEIFLFKKDRRAVNRLINELLKTLPLTEIAYIDNYTLFHLSINYLPIIAQIINTRPVVARHYYRHYGGVLVPTDLEGLQENFRPVKESEMNAIRVFPLNKLHEFDNIDPYVLADITLMCLS